MKTDFKSLATLQDYGLIKGYTHNLQIYGWCLQGHAGLLHKWTLLCPGEILLL